MENSSIRKTYYWLSAYFVLVVWLAVVAGFTVAGDVFKALVNAMDVVDADTAKFTRDGFRVTCFDPGRVMLLDAKVWALDYVCEGEFWVTFPLMQLKDVAKRVKKKEEVRVEVRDGKFYVGAFEVGSVVKEEDVPADVLEAVKGVESLRVGYPEARLKVVLPAFRRIVKSAEAYRAEGYWRERYEYVGLKVDGREGYVVFFLNKEKYSVVEIKGYVDWVVEIDGRAKAVYRMDNFSPLLILGFGDIATLEVWKGDLLRVNYSGSFWSVDFWLAPYKGEEEIKALQEILEKPKPLRKLVWRLEKEGVKDFVSLLKAVDSLVVAGWVKVGVIGEDAWVYWTDGAKGFVRIPKFKFYEYAYPGEPFFGKVSVTDLLNLLKDADVVECLLEGEPPASMFFTVSGAKIPTKELKCEELVKEYAVPEVKGVMLFSGLTGLLRDIFEDALAAEDVFLVFVSSPYELTVLGRNKIYYEATLPVDNVQTVEEDFVATVKLESLRSFFANVPAEKVSVGKFDHSLVLECETKMGTLKAEVFQTAEQLKEALTFYEEYRKPPPPPKPTEVAPLAPPVIVEPTEADILAIIAPGITISDEEFFKEVKRRGLHVPKTDELLKKLIREGVIYEPRPGWYRRTEVPAAPPAPPAVPEKVSREEFMRSFDEALYEWIPHFIEAEKAGLSARLRAEAPEFEAETLARFSMDTVLAKFELVIAKEKDERWLLYSEAAPERAKELLAGVPDLAKSLAASLVRKTADQLLEEAKAKARVKPPPPKELTEAEKKRLEDLFRATLFRELGRIPRDAMAEFRVELDTVKTLPFEEAAKAIESLARDIAAREAERVRVAPPVVPPGVPVEVAPPARIEVIPPPPAVELPKKPLSPLPFPRRPASEELGPLWDAFVYRMYELGLDPWRYRSWYEYYIANAWFSSWDHVLKAFEDLIKDIVEGKPRVIPPKLPWKEFPLDPVLHLLATGRYNTMDELLQALNLHGVYVTAEDVKKIVKEQLAKPREERSNYMIVLSKDYLEKILGERLEGA